jgi:hypothetical protein
LDVSNKLASLEFGLNLYKGHLEGTVSREGEIVE